MKNIIFHKTRKCDKCNSLFPYHTIDCWYRFHSKDKDDKPWKIIATLEEIYEEMA